MADTTSTFYSTHSALALTTTATGWRDGHVPYQGANTGANGSRVGVIQFSKLRSSGIDWATQNIKSVKFTLTFGSYGSSRSKAVVFWRGASDTLLTPASKQMGAKIGSVTASKGYNCTESFTLTGSMLTNFVDWLQNDSKYTLVIYSGKTSTSSSWSSDYLTLTPLASNYITITYEPKGLLGTVENSSMAITGTNTVTISNPTDATLDGTWAWKNGDTTITSGSVSVEGGSTTTVTLEPCGDDRLADLIDFGGAQSITTTFDITTTSTSTTQSYSIGMTGINAPVPTISGSRQTYNSDTGEYDDTFDGSLYRYTVKTVASGYFYTPTSTMTITDSDGTSVYTASLCAGTPTTSGTTYTWTDTASQVGTFLPGETYDVTITTTNQWGGSSTVTATIDKAWAAMHITKDGYGVGLGMFSTGTEAAPRVDVGYPMYLNEGAYGAEVYDTTQDLVVGKWTDSSGTYDIKRRVVVWTGSKTVSAGSEMTYGSVSDLTNKQWIRHEFVAKDSSSQWHRGTYVRSTSNIVTTIVYGNGSLMLRCVGTAYTFTYAMSAIDYIDK